MSFPSNPTNGQTALINNANYLYSSSTNAWTKIAGTVTATNTLLVQSTATSVSPTTGALVVDGGAGVVGNLYVGGSIYQNGILVSGTGTLGLTSTGTNAPYFYISSTASSTSTTTGALIVAGGVGIGGNVDIGGNIIAGGVRSTTGPTTPVPATVGDIWYNTTNDVIYRYDFDGTTSTWVDITGPASMGVLSFGVGGSGGTGASGTGTTTTFVISNTTPSASTITGALQVAGGVGIGGNVYAGGQVVIQNTVPATIPTVGALTVVGGIGVQGQSAFGGQVVISNNTPSTSTYSGALIVSGGISIGAQAVMASASETYVPITGASGVVIHNLALAGTFYHTSPASSFTPSFTNVPTQSGLITVAALIIAQGSPAYVSTAQSYIFVNGQTVIPKWMSSTAPTGNAGKTDIISYSMLNNGGIYTVYGQYSNYG